MLYGCDMHMLLFVIVLYDAFCKEIIATILFIYFGKNDVVIADGWLLYTRNMFVIKWM